jgi:predicted N-acetyltransferase YhbS
MSDTGFIFRHYRDGDETQIVPLLELVFGQWPRFDLECSKIEHWKWKMKDTPTKIVHVQVAETKDGKIIGVSQGQMKRIKIGNEVSLVRKGAELAVHPDYRRMGVSNSIAKLRVEHTHETGAVITHNLTSSPILIRRNEERSKDRHSPQFPHPINQLIKINDMEKFLTYYKKRQKITWAEDLKISIGYKLLKFHNNIKHILKSNQHKSKITINKTTLFSEEIQEFWDKIKDNYDFIVERSKDFLNWRYCDIRGGAYGKWVAKDGEEILGYLVLRVNRLDPDHSIGYIIDLLTLREREDVADVLVKKAVNHFQENKVDAIYFTVISGHPYEKILSKNGFIDSRKKPYLYYRIYREVAGVNDFVNASPERLHYQFGEFDSI